MKMLLEAGLTVHCPVRDPDSPEKVKYLKDVADATEGTIKFFKADLLDVGSYDEAMKGCSVVFHTASPFVMKVDPQKVDEILFNPAIKGTQNVLESCSKTPSVKRVVVTSSSLAILTDSADCFDQPTGVVNEDNWNTTASRTYNPYAYSKVLAEKEAWKMADAQDQYKLVVVNPGWVMGPGIKCHPTSESFNFVESMCRGDFKSGAPNLGCFVVDVRDVARIHVAAGFDEKAEGRYIAVGHNTSILEMAKTMVGKFPDLPISKSAAPWFVVWILAPYIGLTRKFVWRNANCIPTVQNSKSKTDFGIEYLDMETMFKDMIDQMIEGGMVKLP